MNQPEQSEFLTACRVALEEGTFKRATFSSHGKGDAKFRAKFELIHGEQRKLTRYSDNRSDQETTETLDIESLTARMASSPLSPFKAATLNSEDFDLHYSENRKGVARVYKSKPSMRGQAQTHNRSKNYVLREDRPYLQGLGVTNASGKVIKKHHPKFRQIANFVEIIDRDIGAFVDSADEPISLLDLGCGKGYLTFAAYDYINSRAKMPPVGTGIDVKPNVIELCNQLSNKVGFDGLNFRKARIQQDKSENVDILIALHACDTATDDALALGLRSNMKFFFCAPCCQAQIAAQVEHVDSPFELVNTYPLMKRKQADIVTDVCRGLLLKAMGYEVKFLEFTPLEHTPKNIMLAGRKSDAVDRQKAFSDYQELKQAYGFQRHALEENIKDLLSVLPA